MKKERKFLMNSPRESRSKMLKTRPKNREMPEPRLMLPEKRPFKVLKMLSKPPRTLSPRHKTMPALPVLLLVH